jgi:hypothetical protein
MRTARTHERRSRWQAGLGLSQFRFRITQRRANAAGRDLSNRRESQGGHFDAELPQCPFKISIGLFGDVKNVDRGCEFAQQGLWERECESELEGR